MLAHAQRNWTVSNRSGGSIEWQQRSIETWRPASPPDVIFSNAALHWVPDHAHVFPHLMSLLAPQGVLAVQMPHRDGHQPFVESLYDVVKRGPWYERLRDLIPPSQNAPHDYHDWVAPHSAWTDIWLTEYLQVLTGDDPVFTWTASTFQQPFVARLEPDEASAFAGLYRQQLRKLYPTRSDGTTLFPFLRLFIVAARGRP
jgi:trans-aconitate 2-methyltransferase